MSRKKLLCTLAVGAVVTTGSGTGVTAPSHHTEGGFRSSGTWTGAAVDNAPVLLSTHRLVIFAFYWGYSAKGGE
jgi:hypothetical protein